MPKKAFARRTYYRPKWSLNVTNVLCTADAVNATQISIAQNSLIQNPSRTRSTGDLNSVSSAILKAGRVRFKGVISSTMNAGQSAIIALIYLPELINASATAFSYASIGDTVFYSHPEWVMAWTRVDFTNAAQRNEVSLYSRLKRNLNPGDRIALILMNVNASNAAAPSIDLTGTCTYVVRNN